MTLSEMLGGIGVDGRLGGAGPGEHGLDFRLGGVDPFQRHLHGERLFQRRRGNTQRLHGDVAFVQGRDELPPEGRKGQTTDDDPRRARDQDDLRTIDGGADGRLDPTPRVAEQEGFVFVGVAVFVGLDLLGIPHQQGRHGRNEGEGEDEGPDQGQHHRRPHGDEGLAPSTPSSISRGVKTSRIIS